MDAEKIWVRKNVRSQNLLFWFPKNYRLQQIWFPKNVESKCHPDIFHKLPTPFLGHVDSFIQVKLGGGTLVLFFFFFLLLWKTKLTPTLTSSVEIQVRLEFDKKRVCVYSMKRSFTNFNTDKTPT